MMKDNLDAATVVGFGDEWSAFDQSSLVGQEFNAWFEAYFGIFPLDHLPSGAEGFDLGCGSGRWALGVAPRVGLLHCIDPAEKALDVARRRLADHDNVRFHLASADSIPLAKGSQDFGYSLGVLHHVPDPSMALRKATATLKEGAPFLLYLYYAFDHRPSWFRRLWLASNLVRLGISRLPFRVRRRVTDLIALLVYWPLSRAAGVLEKRGIDPSPLPLSGYRRSSFYTLRTDSLDRFGTRLEHRFSRAQMEAMMAGAGLTDIRFSDHEPYWVACGRKAS
jgi:SAM-dependent methyltransferase